MAFRPVRSCYFACEITESHVLPEVPPYPLAETRFGRMFTLRGDSVIGRSLRVYGEFAGDEVDSILALIRPGDHVLDLGANIGFHTLALARSVGPEGHVTAVEPQRYCFQLLSANVTLNQLARVHCLRAAVGDVAGTCAVPLHHPTARHNAGAVEVVQGTGSGPTDEVPLITVDGLELARCDLIKVDTEGFEDRVIKGARATIAAFRPVLYIEVHDREKLRWLVATLKPQGYGLSLHNTYFFRENNANGEPAVIFPASAGGSALIAVPPRRDLPTGLPGQLVPIG